ncbi:MAG: NUDIX hydrolase [Elusimicrobia bacterium]|nr:NUDIX hydrolase [Elusimicrobiota bacterium]
MPRSLVETLEREVEIYRGHCVNFRADRVRLPNGKTALREYMDHPGAVAVVPFLDPRTVVLVRQYRFPVRAITLELPAGKLDAKEAPLACIRRELREETGYTARKITQLLDFWPTPAFANERLRIYLAEGLSPGRLCLDPDEFLEVVVLPFKKALSLVRAGKIRDSKTVIGLLACAQRPRR